MKEAKYWEKLNDNQVKCLLCPNFCIINNEKVGRCLNRKNQNGILYTLNYSRVSSIAVDPVEKKPLYHFYPGKEILSFGTTGCSLKCDFCQNSSISMAGPGSTKFYTPDECIQTAVKQNLKLIAYTYNEPFIWFEHVLETAKIAHQNGMKNVLVTNGYYNNEPFEELLPFIDAMNIDLKAFTGDFYRTFCGGKIEPVLETIKKAYKHTHIEITTLIITKLNDDFHEINKLIDFIAEIDNEIPFHISKYFPRYKRTSPATDENLLLEISKKAKLKLKHVYVGNAMGFGNDTFCANCNARLIKRNYYTSNIININNGLCNTCNKKLYGFFD